MVACGRVRSCSVVSGPSVVFGLGCVGSGSVPGCGESGLLCPAMVVFGLGCVCSGLCSVRVVFGLGCVCCVVFGLGCWVVLDLN